VRAAITSAGYGRPYVLLWHRGNKLRAVFFIVVVVLVFGGFGCRLGARLAMHTVMLPNGESSYGSKDIQIMKDGQFTDKCEHFHRTAATTITHKHV
jgi:hypothetical protein